MTDTNQPESPPENPSSDDGPLGELNPYVEITVRIYHDGSFNFSIPNELNPIIVAGVGWQLVQMAEIGFQNQLMAMAQEQQRKPGIVVPGQNRAMRRHRN